MDGSNEEPSEQIKDASWSADRRGKQSGFYIANCGKALWRGPGQRPGRVIFLMIKDDLTMAEYEIPAGIMASKENHVEHVSAHMLIVVGPSGTGKSTLLGHLMSVRNDCGMSRSTTTRAPRGQEQNGVEYDFVDIPTFEKKIANGDFVEYANVFGNYYGTPHKMISQNVESGRNVLFDIDVQGARSLKKQYPGAWCVLIAPPSMEILEKRLRGRGTDAPEVIDRRLNTARKELAECDLFDFVIINDDLQTAQNQLVQLYDMLMLRAGH